MRSYGDPEAPRRTLDGVETLFMVSGSEYALRLRRTEFLDRHPESHEEPIAGR